MSVITKKTPSFLREEIPIFEVGENIQASVQHYWEYAKKLIFEKMDVSFPARRLVQLHSLMMDEMVTQLFKYAFEATQSHGIIKTPIALFALGGYGRAELNLYSDLDLLFLYEGKNSQPIEMISQKMLYPLWDAKLEVGYSTRTLSDCARVMKEDVRATSAMLDARFLAGDRELGERFQQFLEKQMSSKKAFQYFIREKTTENEERLKRFGASVYMVEPNLKESEGGLRDWHTLRYFTLLALKTEDPYEWVRRAFITNEELEMLNRAVDFLLLVREWLHRRVGKSQDKLFFEHQEAIAKALGYQDSKNSLAAEKFMKDYYSHASNLMRLRQEVTRKLYENDHKFLDKIKSKFRLSLSRYFCLSEGQIQPKDYEVIEANPVEVMRAFYLAQKKSLKLDEEFKSWISRHLYFVDQAYRENPEVCQMMREMFADGIGIGQSLWEMHDCRFLGVLMPEFGDILFQTQHDVYHIYTVDTHSIKAVQEISKLKKGEYDEEFPLFKKAMQELSSDEVLVLGTLFHDIGKGRGGRHSEVGAEIAERVMKRMGYDRAEIKKVVFLVLAHLIMPHLSQRRDLEDFNMINQFARTIESLERLNLLFILTWADIRAVGPEVWTPWKGSLLRELYQKTRHVLEEGDFSRERATVIVEQIKNKTLQIGSHLVDQDNLKNFLNKMPPRYFIAHGPKKILKHFNILQQERQNGLIFDFQVFSKAKYSRILIHTLHTPHIFEQITGVMAANKVNILSLEQFIDSEGTVLVLLKVTGEGGLLLEDKSRFEVLRKALGEIFLGRVNLEKYYKKQQSSPLLAQKKNSRLPPRVDIDNMVSPYYTVIDVYASDRIGLLYDLVREMRKMNLFIEVSKISTKVDQVADVFYVKDIFGQKITDRRKISAIKKPLMDLLEEKNSHE